MRTKRRKRGKSTDPTPPLPKGEGDLGPGSGSLADNYSDWKTGEYKGSKPNFITANPYTYPIIKDYRKDRKDHQTESELLLWQFLRNNKIGHKIRRQHIIGNFIVDFVCLAKKLVIELDGKIHQFEKEKDKIRTIHLNNLGYEVIRFPNDEVLNSPEVVALKIKLHLDNQTDSNSIKSI